MNKLLVIVITSIALSLTAQETSKPYFSKNNFFGFNFAAGGGGVTPSLYWIKQHAFGEKKRFRLGYGARLTSYFGNNLQYQTAPAKYTSGETGPQVLFIETKPENIDTLLFNKSNIAALNLSINLEYQVYKKWSLAFNIDAVGASIGGKQNVIHNKTGQTAVAKPTNLNLLLISDNDIGTLNSELLVKYQLNNHITLVGGFGFLFTEYTTDSKYKLGNDRFRNKSGQLTLGFAYTPFKTY